MTSNGLISFVVDGASLKDRFGRADNVLDHPRRKGRTYCGLKPYPKESHVCDALTKTRHCALGFSRSGTEGTLEFYRK